MTRQQRRDRRPWARVENAIRRRPWKKCERDLCDALKSLYVGQARIYRGDRKLAGRAGQPWTSGANNRCSPTSIWRAKRRLEAAHILALTRTDGGFIRNARGEPVRAATGYEPHPDLYLQTSPPRPPRPAPRRSEAAASDRVERFTDFQARQAAMGGRDGP